MSEVVDGTAIRTALEVELGRIQEPPLGALVETSLRKGRRHRRLRTAARLGGAGTAVAAVVFAVAAGQGLLQQGANGPAVEAAIPAASTTKAAPTKAAPTKAGAVTIESAKAQLQKEVESALKAVDITATPTYEYASNEDVAAGAPVVRVVLDAGRGKSMFQLISDPNLSTSKLSKRLAVTVERDKSNCLSSLSVMALAVDRPGMQLDVATCLTWNGTENPPSPAALTKRQASAVASRAPLQIAVAQATAAMTEAGLAGK